MKKKTHTQFVIMKYKYTVYCLVGKLFIWWTYILRVRLGKFQEHHLQSQCNIIVRSKEQPMAKINWMKSIKININIQRLFWIMTAWKLFGWSHTEWNIFCIFFGRWKWKQTRFRFLVFFSLFLLWCGCVLVREYVFDSIENVLNKNNSANPVYEVLISRIHAVLFELTTESNN